MCGMSPAGSKLANSSLPPCLSAQCCKLRAGFPPPTHSCTAPAHACRLKFAAPTSVPPTQHPRLSVSSSQGLELTLTAAAVEAAALAGGALQAAAATAADASAFEAQLEAAGSNAAYSAAYWLHNHTGSTLELWLAAADAAAAASLGGSRSGRGSDSGYSSCDSSPGEGEGQLPRVPAGQPQLVVRPGGRVVLPVITASRGQQQGLHVGTPCPHNGVSRRKVQRHHHRQHQANSGLSPAAGSTVGPAAELPGTPGTPCGDGADAEAPSRSLLYFRLAEQADISGPVHLDR